MIKGSMILRQYPYGKWVGAFKTWLKSDRAALIIHCKTSAQVRYVQKSAIGFRDRTGEKFWTHAYGNDIYCIHPNRVLKNALEVSYDDQGVIYYYDSESQIKLEEPNA